MKLSKVFGVFAATIALYVLSIGPAIWVSEKYGFPIYYRTNPDAFETFYRPVLWLAENEPIGDALDWYMLKWQPKFYGKGAGVD